MKTTLHIVVLTLSFMILLLAARADKAPMYGVNLGGWLVLESWITPTLFSNNSVPSGVGEWQFCEKLGKNRAKEVLEKHWDEWLQEKELQTLAAAGVTHVRIPVGYWIIGDLQPGEPYVSGGWEYLLRALGWCKKHGLRALIDLHGAP